MAEKVLKTAIIKDIEYLYFIQEDGHIWRNKKTEGSLNKKNAELVLELNLIREEGYVYYIDKDGDISRTPDSKKFFKLRKPLKFE